MEPAQQAGQEPLTSPRPPSYDASALRLRTERLSLRPVADADADDLLALDADAEVTRFLTGGRPTPREVLVGEVLPRMTRRYGAGGRLGYWIAEDEQPSAPATGAFLGWFCLTPTDEPGTVSLGYRLRRSAWGAGLATEGATALVRLAFTELPVRRVVATTMTVNAASRRVLEKAGLEYVRRFFADWPDVIADGEHGDVEYAADRDRWRRTVR